MARISGTARIKNFQVSSNYIVTRTGRRLFYPRVASTLQYTLSNAEDFDRPADGIVTHSLANYAVFQDGFMQEARNMHVRARSLCDSCGTHPVIFQQTQDLVSDHYRCKLIKKTWSFARHTRDEDDEAIN